MNQGQGSMRLCGTWQLNPRQEEDTLGLPPLESGSERELLREETRSDASLATWRNLADAKSKGFKWRDGLVFLTVTDPTFQAVEVLVLPMSFRDRVLKTAHDGAGIERCSRW